MSEKGISKVAIITDMGTSIQGSTILPGNLLAEFKGKLFESDVQKLQDGTIKWIPIMRGDLKTSVGKKEQPVHILILEEK